MGDSLVVQWLGLRASTAEARFSPSLRLVPQATCLSGSPPPKKKKRTKQVVGLKT